MNIKRALRRRLPMGVVQEMATYARYALRPTYEPRKRFCVFGSSRSGSTLFVSLLNSHPGIHCDLEILHDRVLFPRAFIAARTKLSPAPAVGFKLLSYQLTEVQRMGDSAAYIRWLAGEQFTLIYLRRRNRLRRALSTLAARARKSFHQRSPSSSPREAIHVDLTQLRHWLDHGRDQERLEDEVLAGLSVVPVSYEDDLESSDKHQATSDRIMTALDLPTSPVETTLVKLMPGRLEDLIANFGEVERSLRNTEYAEFLSH